MSLGAVSVAVDGTGRSEIESPVVDVELVFSGPEGVAVDSDGNVYGIEVSQRRVTKWIRFRP